MANIRVDVDYQIVDGQPLVFKAPCPCSEANGLTVYYAIGNGKVLSKEFTFKDAHGNDLTNVNNLFDANAYVKVVLNIKDGFAYLQNADTNAYLEGKFEEVDSKLKNTHPVGSVVITSTNENPSNKLGGTWELVDKHFKKVITSTGSKVLGDKIQYAFFDIYKDIHSAAIVFEIVFKEDFNETNYQVSKLTASNIGFLSGYGTVESIYAKGENGNAIVFCDLAINDERTGWILTIQQAIFGANSNGFKAGERVVGYARLSESSQYIDEKSCDKFYWKRTA